VTTAERAFVTGGSGFVGGAIVRHALARGGEVRALARTERAAASIARLGATPIRVTLDDEAGLIRAMRGTATVFHVAGAREMCARDPTGMDRVNVQGTDAVMRAAARADVGRVVHTSSAATIGEPAGTIGREDTVHRGSFLNEYERSKLLGERRAFEAGREYGVQVVSVNPSSVQGPGRTEGTARLLIGAARSWVAVLVHTWVSVVDVDDCAEAHLLAAEHGTPGQRYVVSGTSLPVVRAVDLVRRLTGRPRHVLWMPRGAAETAVPLLRGVTAFRRHAGLCPAMLRTLLHGHRYDGSRATRDLGVHYTALDRTLERTLDWYAERGLLGPGTARRMP
jgi:dihydroflavonol-4-reductase